MRTQRTTLTAGALMLSIIFALAVWLVPMWERTRAGSDSAGLLLRGVREALAAKSIDAADRYFHRGTEHAVRNEAITNSWFQCIHAAVSPQDLVHREGASTGEVVPWLWLGSRLSATNLEYLLTTAYWLQVSGHPEKAATMLAEAQRQQRPHSAIYLARARVAFALGRQEQARSLLQAGQRCSPAADHDESLSEEERNLRDTIQLYLGYIAEKEGRTNDAVRVFRRLYQQQPERRMPIGRRADRLAAGEPVQPTAAECLDALSHARSACAEDDHEDHHH